MRRTEILLILSGGRPGARRLLRAPARPGLPTLPVAGPAAPSPRADPTAIADTLEPLAHRPGDGSTPAATDPTPAPEDAIATVNGVTRARRTRRR